MNRGGLGARSLNIELQKELNPPGETRVERFGWTFCPGDKVLKMGVTQFDSTVGGLGGCPFAGQPKAAGNICTEELVLLCEEMGIDTGVDLDALIEVGRMAEEIVGHQLPGELIHAGSLDVFRRQAAA
jgi:hypothetical protein